MGVRLNASSTGGAGASADASRTKDVTIHTEETELYLMSDHRMEPMGVTDPTSVPFPVGCKQLRVCAFFEDDEKRQWQCYKNKVYSNAPKKKKNVVLTALDSNILPYTKGRSKSTRPFLALGGTSQCRCHGGRRVIGANVIAKLKGGSCKTV